MKFFHVYNEECFKGLEKNGLINKDTGFKIQHVFRLQSHMKFNELAAKDGKLYNLLKEGNYPFYVDRIAGGTTYHKYDFSSELIHEYENLLGDWFLGFQLHESGSNRRQSDWRNMIEAMGSKGPYDLETLREKMLSPIAKMPDGTRLCGFFMDGPEYYANQVYAETYEEFIEEMKDMFSRRMEEVDGFILPCDSYYLATKLQEELGMRTYMPEVGCQIPLMRIAVSLARGMAKASGKTWGTYYECWREVPGIGYCMPVYNDYPLNEWYAKPLPGMDDFWSRGENGGSSRLLQNRIYYYTLMSGADYFSEEWGLNCSYSDMQEFTLSSYGETKKTFINSALDLQGVQAKVPFAIVLPKRYSCIELPDIFTAYEIGNHSKTYLDSPLSDADQKYYGHLEDVLKLFFARSTADIVGNEGHVITNSRFGDLFDIIYEDASDDALKKYDYLIDATAEGTFAKAKSGKGLAILESGNIEKLEAEVRSLIQEVMPCYVDGLCWLVSTDEKGRRFLTIFNNEGNERSLEVGDIIHAEADAKVKITFKEPVNLKVYKEAPKAIQIEKIDDCSYWATIPAAGFAVIEF